MKHIIPPEVLRMILDIYAYGTMHTYKNWNDEVVPNIICDRDGHVYTSWKEIFKVRAIHRALFCGKGRGQTRKERLDIITAWVEANKIDTTLTMENNKDELLILAHKAKVDGIYSLNTLVPDIARSLGKYFKKIRREKKHHENR